MEKWITRFLLMCVAAVSAVAVCVILPTPEPPPDPPPPNTNAPTSGTAMTFPVEVLGGDGSTESISFYVTNGQLATNLFLKVHGITYPAKLSVRINGGSWQTPTNQNSYWPYTLEMAAWKMGWLDALGVQNPPLSTLRFGYPNVWTTIDGTNTFEFRFNDLDGFTVGFRVLDLNLQHAGTNLIADTQKSYEDPSTWVAPVGGDATAGGIAWTNLAIGERGVPIRANCQTCHPAAFDLKYFNYSNKSIIQRAAIQHNVPLTDATNMAAFVRSVPIGFVTGARPWNPPYQPGPGLDAQSVYNWASGAGSSNVLDNDLDTLTDIWPSGITTNYLNLTNIVNARQIRLAMQFPDWNHWLPQIAPIDCYTNSPDMATNRFVTIFPEIISNLNVLPTTGERALYFNSQKSTWDQAGSTTGVPIPSTSDPGYAVWNQKERSMRHWRVAMTWYIMNAYGLQDQGLTVYPTYTNSIGQTFPPNQRTWFHGEVFNLSPHKTGQPHYQGFALQSAMWYQLQLVLNDSQRHNPSIVPIDWGYQHALLISAFNNDVNYPWFSAEVLNIIKAQQTFVNGLPLSDPSSFRFGREQLKWVQNAPEMTGIFAMVPLLTRQQVGNAVVLLDLQLAQWFTRPEYFAAYTDNGLNFYSNNIHYYGDGQNRMQSIGMDPNIIQMWNDWGDYLFGP